MTIATDEPEWLELEAVVQAHDLSIQRYGGATGLRDAGLLKSALDRPRNRFAYDGVSDLASLAATYAVGLAKNHAFADGNKRVAFAALGAFLMRNGLRLVTTQQEAIQTMYAVAAGEIELDALADWVRANTQPA